MAGFNVDTIRSTLQTSGGFATTEKYSVVFTGLSSQLNQGVNASFQYLCENVAIPTIIIPAIKRFAALGFLAHHEIILYITYDTPLDSKIIGVSSIPS